LLINFNSSMKDANYRTSIKEKNESAEERMILIADLLKKWMKHNSYLVGHPEKSNRTCTRFTTDTMSKILPDIPNSPSGWNTDNHYFYEIVNRSGSFVTIQISFNSRNITKEQRIRLNQINKFTPNHQAKADWIWWLAYKTDRIYVPEDLNQEVFFARLDRAMHKVLEFEKELKQNLEAEYGI